MLPKKTKHLLYALLLIFSSIVGTSAIANTSVLELLSEVSIAFKSKTTEANKTVAAETKTTFKKNTLKNASAIVANAPMFITVFAAPDDTNVCGTDGLEVALFNLCGDSDNRIITLTGSPNPSAQWQILGGSCSPDLTDACPNQSASCYTTVHTGSDYTLNAASIPAGTGAEFRVLIGGVAHYFEVKKSTITQSFVKKDFICGVDGEIQITGLSSAYEFSMNSGSGFGPWQGPIFGNLSPGTYNVKARLRNTAGACEYPYAPITINQLDMGIDVTFVDAQCSGDTGSVTVTVTGGVPGPFKYTLLDENLVAQEFTSFIADNPYTFSAVSFGSYTVQVETQQCTGDPGNGIDPPRENRDTSNNPIVIGNGLDALDASTEVNSSFGCSTISDVDITVNTTGGSAPYTFTVNGGPSQPSYTGSTTYTVSSAGTYDFIITDSNGCTIPASASVESLDPPDVTANGIDGTCSNGGAKINFNIIDPKGYNLTYRVNSGDPWDTNPQISVPAGTYNDIEVRYQQGGFECTIPLPSVTVTNVGVISGSSSKVSDRTCDGSGGVNGGQIDFVGPFTGGSGSGYVFSIDGTNFTGTTSYTNLGPGTYTPMIEDGGGCRLELTPITILDVDPPTDIDFVSSDSNCTSNTVDVQIVPTSSALITNYSIISPASEAHDNFGNDTFDDLDASQSYIFQITDANNCTYTEGYSPNIISSIRARVKSGGDLKVCTGATDGTGTFLIDGFANNYTYNINGGAESGPQNDSEVVLPPSGAGIYTITITDDDTGCTDTASFEIEEPTNAIALTGNVTAMTCANGNLGRVVAQATGGWGSNRYELAYPDGTTTAGPKAGTVFSNLGQTGTYTLTVEDVEGCSATFDFDLTSLDAPTLAFDAAGSDLCFVAGTGATIVVNSTAGTAALGTHQYRINGGALQGSATFTNLSPGNHTIEVVDGNNCSDNINITVNPQLRVNTSITGEIPCGGADGQITVEVTGGYLTNATPKSYEVSSDNGTTFGAPIPLTSNTFAYDTNTPGDYIFRVSDNENCVAESNPITLNPPVNIDPAAVDIIPVSCGSANNGVVTITPDATSGIPPYEISFNGGTFGTQSVFSNLAAGTYPYLVRDSRGCTTVPADAIVGTDTTSAPNATVTEEPATCSAGPVSGGVNIIAMSPGSPNYTFIVEDVLGVEQARLENVSTFPTQILSPNLIPGTYTVVTIDANGCRDEDTVTITEPNLSVVPDGVIPVCSDTGFTDTVEIFGGTGSFLIRLENDPSAPVPPNAGLRRHTFSGLQYGVTYTVEVTDTRGDPDPANWCIYFEEIPPTSGPTLLEVTATSTPDFCDVNRNGEITYTIDNFTLGDNLQVEILDNTNGTQSIIETVTPLTVPYSNTHLAIAGDYQIIVTNLADDCSTATSIIVEQNLPGIDIIAEEPATCNSPGQIVVQGNNGDGGPYEFAFMDSGSTPSAGDWTTNTSFIAVANTYDVYVRDSSGCTSFAIATVVQSDPVLPAPISFVDNQCVVTATAFDIRVTIPNTVDTPRFTLGGDERLAPDVVDNGTHWEYTYTVASPGTYFIDVVDANGCTSQGTAVVYDFLSISASFSTEPSCNAADGIIEILPIGGSNQFSYQLQDSGGVDIGAPILGDRNQGEITNVAPGSYIVEVTDTETNCVVTATINLDAATPPIIDTIHENDISCEGENDGSIDIILQTGTDVDGPIVYSIFEAGTTTLAKPSNASGSFIDLVPGFYDIEVRTDRNCIAVRQDIEIEEPALFSISASAPDFACEPGANRYSSTIITVAIDNPGTSGLGPDYQYSITGFSNYQSANTFEIVDNGDPAGQTITVYAIDANGCQSSTNVSIAAPSDVTPTLTVVSALNCRDDERVRITVPASQTTSFTVSTISAVAIAPVTNAPGNDFVEIDLPVSGDYLFEVEDLVGGCTYPLPIHTVSEPILPTVVITETKPISCFGTSDGEISIEVTDYTGVYTYNVYSGSDPGKTTVLATGSFDTANNPETITGLAGGNVFVEVISVAMPFCSAESNVTTIRSPNGALDLSAVEVGNVGCNEDTGHIEATGVNGWDTVAYEYRLLRDDGTGYVEIVSFGTDNEFETLASGDYRVEIRDVEGCRDTFDITLDPIPGIQAGIREPQALVCPNGNNAILEAFDPTTGDETSATAGATGGFPGAGYNYRLLYLNSDDNTDIASTSGLQNSPTFIGTSGGYISGGWYAIEVSSSFNCVGVTVPYFVNPPPPVQPKLIQTAVPGCGGQGEIQLSIENYNPAFTYEIQPLENGVVAGPYSDMTGQSMLFLRNAGISYQFDVRKKNASNTCLAVRTGGITMTDAAAIEFLPNSPVDDISCSGELDGRIESFANGGVGGNQFYLYSGDPVDAFSPAASATLIRGPQDHGTFEGLDAGSDYYITVTSGATCSAIAGPFEITRPEPIVFDATPGPISCFGESDGSITIEVNSGGVGLLQFALGPNFNEFFSDVTTPGMYTFEDLAAGSYEILIQDENGCFEKDFITVVEPAELIISDITTSPETCIGFADGTVQLTITGGTPFVDTSTSVQYYQTKIVGPNSDGTEIFERNDNLYFDNLVGGESYIIIVQDANFCFTDVIIPITIGVDLTAEPVIQYGCEGIFPNSTVSISMQDASLYPDLLFALDPVNPSDATSANATATFTWGDLDAGDHTVYIYHQNGCTNSVDFTMESYDPLTLTAEKTGPNEVTAIAEGGYGGYVYSFQGESQGDDNVYTTNESEVVTIQVTDQTGCVAVVTIPFEFTGMLEIPNFFTPDGDGNNDVWFPNNRNFFPNIEVIIYDRYGRVVARLDQVTSWDGTYESKPVPSGDYWYEVNANDKSKMHYIGHFTLYR
ncbi:T9SS type B sorting domain-containing protein [Aurantibacter crassamenti]|uniref:T9SS type B sorting domain-containing protein n=1 Tax=Aurantibacter crassamenti TaxID=1837375 RepID=UPI0019392B71|nr:T9SS type B sorting domain-containing protein [Aurantibacter crassamenti]MBM1106726.1 T9SS type B sorting domain-containing protein [Aurantibacter crassamenti]